MAATHQHMACMHGRELAWVQSDAHGNLAACCWECSSPVRPLCCSEAAAAALLLEGWMLRPMGPITRNQRCVVYKVVERPCVAPRLLMQRCTPAKKHRIPERRCRWCSKVCLRAYCWHAARSAHAFGYVVLGPTQIRFVSPGCVEVQRGAVISRVHGGVHWYWRESEAYRVGQRSHRRVVYTSCSHGPA